MQEMDFRLGDSGFFLGGKYVLNKISVPKDDLETEAVVDPEDLELWNSGLALISEYDNLNNFISPTRGMKFHLSYSQFLEVLGSNKDWGILKFYSHLYFPIREKWISAVRVESSVSSGRPPFYAYPYISLRGIPALRYQGRFTMLAETEQTYNFHPRWGVTGFAGIGGAFRSVENTDKNVIAWNYGGGIRYLLIKDLGLRVGFDAGRGPEDWAYYVMIGKSW